MPKQGEKVPSGNKQTLRVKPSSKTPQRGTKESRLTNSPWLDSGNRQSGSGLERTISMPRETHCLSRSITEGISLRHIMVLQ